MLHYRNQIGFSNDDKDIINVKFYDWLMYEAVGCKPVMAPQKTVPIGIRRASKNVVRSFLRGLFDTDGGANDVEVHMSSSFEQLIREIQIMLLGFGIISRRRFKPVKYKEGRRDSWYLSIGSDNIDLFAKEIGFRSKTKSRRLNKLLGKARNPNKDVIPYYFDKVTSVQNSHGRCWDIHVPHNHSFISNGVVSHNTFMLGVHALLRSILIPGEEILVVGKAFRQSKKVFEYIEKLYNNSPVLQEAINGSLKKYNTKRKDAISHGSDRYEMYIGLSRIIALPIGDGESIRGQRATTLLVDEFASVNEEILEIVITPFLSVAKNPQERAEMTSLLSRLKKLGATDHAIEQIIKKQGRGNQMVISGTASSQFNHFYKYFLQYRHIIESKGDPASIRRAMSQTAGEAAESIPDEIIESVCHTWKQYCIYRLPYNSLPDGYLDQAMVARNRLMFTKSRFDQEYLCLFPEEIGGFIPYSLIKDATPTGEDAVEIELFGEPGARYVMGIDPARCRDYFAICLLKLEGAKCRLVFAKSFYRREYTKIVPYIVDLTKRFNVVQIRMDAGGGGQTVADLLCNPDIVKNQDEIIFDIDEDNHKYKTYGKKILKLQNFTNAWIDEAINAMKSDIEHKRLLFPRPSVPESEDVIMRQYARFKREPVDRVFTRDKDGNLSRPSQALLNDLSDELLGIEDDDGMSIDDGIVAHVNETIRETCAIEQQGLPNSQNVRYDLPKIPIGAAEDVRHRDRYTALLLASYAYRVEMSLDHKGYVHQHSAASLQKSIGRGHRRGSGIRRGNSGGIMSVDYGAYYRKMKRDRK
jgi:hypothetical protein